jgi:hypothetical protein
MKYVRFLIPAALLLLCSLAIGYAIRVPRPLSAAAPPTAFSAARAISHVSAIARGPRPAGSAEHARVRGYIVAQAAAIGLRAQVQELTAVGTRYAIAGRVRNVLVRLPGRAPGGMAVLLVAHYDGVAGSPAAADDASGAAVLLETLRALKSGAPLAHDVIALFTDAEENGLLGAAGFVAEHPWAKNVGVVLNFEARGTHGPSLMFETGRDNLDVVRVLRGISGVRATSLSTAVYRALPNDTDLSELAALDRPAMNFAFIGGVQRYHSGEDDVAHLNAGSVQHHGDQALGLARAFGNGPLPRPVSGDAVFFDLPVLGLVVYPVGLALPIAAAALALVITAIIRRRRVERRWFRSILVGASSVVVCLALVAGTAIGVTLTVQRLHAALQSGGAPEWSGIYAAAVAVLTLAIVAACYALARRWASAEGGFLGALLVVAILAAWVSAQAPGMSFVFVWPVFFTALATLAASVAPRSIAVMTISGAVSVAVVVFLIVPTVYLMVCVALGLDPTGAAILAVFTAIAAWCLVPLLEATLGDDAWRGPLALGVAGAILLVAGAVSVRESPAKPGGAALVYALDGDSQRAWLTGYATTMSARSWLERAIRSGSSGRPAAAPPLWLTQRYNPRRIAAAPAPEAAIDSPSATVVSDSANRGGVRVVTLRVQGSPGTRSIALAAEPGVVLDAAVDGRRVERARYRRSTQRWVLEFIDPPESGFTLMLILGPAKDPALSLEARRGGLPRLQGRVLPVRPPGILPIQEGDMTIVHKTLPLGL